MNNKVTYGLKNVHYAVFDERSESYLTPIPLKGAAELKLSSVDEVNETDIYSSSGLPILYFYTNRDYEGSLLLSVVPEHFYINCLGQQKKSANDVLVESDHDVHSSFALLFEFDGDQNKTRHILYRCYATRPSVSSTSRGGSMDISGQEMSLRVLSTLEDGKIKAKVNNTGTEPSKTIYENWFNEVQFF